MAEVEASFLSHSDAVQTNQPSRCTKHGGRLIELYCPSHKAVGCSTCIIIGHSSCQHKQYIQDIAKGIKESQEYKNLQKDMKMVKSRFDALKNQREAYQQHLDHNKQAILEQITDTRNTINALLDKMERELQEGTEPSFKEKTEIITARITELEISLEKIKQTMDRMSSDYTESDIFVACKIGRRQFQEELCDEIDEQEKVLPLRQLEVHLDERVKQTVERRRELAEIKENYTVQGIEYNGEEDIHQSDDKNVCSILSMCALPDGSLAMADFNNQKIKKFDKVANNLTTLIGLPGHPAGICLVDTTHLAVSLIYQKKVQFVSLSPQIALARSFRVDGQCRGLSYCDGLLYVCSGGSPVHNEERVRGRVGVYNRKGQLLRCWYEKLECPEYMSVINNGFDTQIYLSDYHQGLQLRTPEGNIKHQFPTNLDTYTPFCLIGNNQICVGENATGNNNQICVGENATGNMYNLTYNVRQQDLARIPERQPLSMHFDDKSSQLIIAFKNWNIIRVYDLKI